MEKFSLAGQFNRLEPLDHEHATALTAASSGHAELYRWSPVPQNLEAARLYIGTALNWQKSGTAVPFAIIRVDDGSVIGSTRFWNLEFWSWPPGHPRYGRKSPDACEIGYTWLASSALRSSANTEAKLLMLTHAFENWQVLRVCLHTDARNLRSRAAIERIGGQYEGILRAHRPAADFTARDSVRYSILSDEWPGVRQRLLERLHERRSA